MFQSRFLDVVCRPFVGAVCSILLFAAQSYASLKDEIGFTQLEKELGSSVPSGTNVSIAQIEAIEGGGWAPKESGELAGKNLNYAETPAYSSHAYEVASYLIGSTRSILGRVKNLSVLSRTTYAYKSLWAGRTFFPEEVSWDVENHSWGGDFVTDNVQILQRMDYRAERDGIVIVAGVNNGSSSSLSPVVANLYNGITVGVSSGQHARSGSTLEGTGRQKPDIVVPVPVTSYATPVVASSAALLLSEAKKNGSLSAARYPAAIKAILLAGATKDGLSWSHSQSHPLDKIYGAGELNVYRSFKILKSGQSSPGEAATPRGWDVARTASQGVRYRIDVASGQTMSLSAVLAWHREILATGSNWNTSVGAKYSGMSYARMNTRMPNLDLVLWRLGSTSSSDTQVTRSSGTVDNVEHVFENLSPGRYALEVKSSSTNVRYALAWDGQITGKATATPTPTPAPTPAPKPTPTPKPNPTPTPTPKPTKTPTPTPTTTPSSTDSAGGDRVTLKGGNLGDVGKSGKLSYDSAAGIYAVTGSGSGMVGWDDAFYFASDAADSSTAISVRLDDLDGSSYAQAGLTLRDSKTSRSPQVSIYANRDGAIVVSARTTSSSAVVGSVSAKSLPIWLRLKRSGSKVAAAYSKDGSKWTIITTVDSTLASGGYAGLATASGGKGSSATASFKHLDQD